MTNPVKLHHLQEALSKAFNPEGKWANIQIEGVRIPLDSGATDTLAEIMTTYAETLILIAQGFGLSRGSPITKHEIEQAKRVAGYVSQDFLEKIRESDQPPTHIYTKKKKKKYKHTLQPHTSNHTHTHTNHANFLNTKQ